MTTQETVTETNRLQAHIDPAAPPSAAPAEEPVQVDFAALVRGYADHKAHCERLEFEHRVATERFNHIRTRLIEQTPRLTEPVAYVIQDQPGLAYVLRPPANGEKVGSMEITPIVPV